MTGRATTVTRGTFGGTRAGQYNSFPAEIPSVTAVIVALSATQKLSLLASSFTRPLHAQNTRLPSRWAYPKARAQNRA